jgi:lipoprotein-anchoring transpeptidase ErfK/SrfK
MTSHRIKREHLLRRWLPSGLVVAAAAASVVALTHFHGVRPRLAPAPTSVSPAARINTSPTQHAAQSQQRSSSPATHAQQAAPSPCRINTDAQHVIVSISSQHAWICAGKRQVNQSAVTTGATTVGNGTPLGTWHVQAKQTDRMLTVLSGESYHVDYWLPYDGSYGFHDAVWQTFPFGSGLYRSGGSHGCVHFPLATMKWLYNWTQVGAAVTIKS